MAQKCDEFEPELELPPQENLCDEYGDAPDWEIGVGTPYTHSSQLPGGLLSQQVYVKGDFIINSDFTFYGSVLSFADDVSLIVQNRLTLDGAKLFACNCLWNGIVLESGSQITAHAGFFFREDNNDTNFSSNTMIGGSTSVLLLGFFGEQVHQGNKWFEYSVGGNGASIFVPPGEVDASISSYPPILSKFTVHTNQSILNSNGNSWDFFSEYYPHDVRPNTSDFFEVKPSGIPQFCNPQAPPPTPPSVIDDYVASGQFAQLSINEAAVWEAERYLYQKINNAEESIYTDLMYSNFMANHESSNIGKYYLVDQKIEESFESPLLSEIEVFSNDLASVLDDLELNDSLLLNATENSEIEQLRQNKIDLMADLHSIQYSLLQYDSIYKQNKIAILTEANQINQEVIPTTNYELNEKKVNEIYLQSLITQNGELTSEQINELAVIAQQCPDEAGWSVYTALGLLPTCWRKSLDLCEYEIELPQVRATQFNNNEKLVNQSMIFPNPATSEVTFKFKDDLTGEVRLFDLTGKKVLSITKVVSGEKVSIASLQDGIYFLRTTLSDGTSFSEKFVIQ